MMSGNERIKQQLGVTGPSLRMLLNTLIPTGTHGDQSLLSLSRVWDPDR